MCLPVTPIHNRTLTDETVRKMAVERPGALFPEEIQGYTVTKEMVLNVLVMAAAKSTSLRGACEGLAGVATDDSIRNHVSASLARRDLYELNLAINRTLQAELPEKLRKGRWHIAMDLHDQPYYGHSDSVSQWLCGRSAKGGRAGSCALPQPAIVRSLESRAEESALPARPCGLSPPSKGSPIPII